MDFNLRGKSVVVTAASKGLGRAIAEEFAREGAYVLISSRDEQVLAQTAEELKKKTANEQISFISCDMKNEDDIQQMIHEAVKLHGTVDVLINNAGGPPAGPFMEMSDEDWYHAFELNLLSYVRTIRQTVPIMQKQNYGRIVNIASSSIKQSIDNLVLSNTIRPGIVGLSKTLAQELSEDNILINTVGPGTIHTERIDYLNQKLAEKHQVPLEQIQENDEKTIPIKRYGKPEEFAKPVVFLASEANTYITGQTLLVDGGAVKAL